MDAGGGRGIRTPGTVSGTTVFKTAAIDRSAIPPRAPDYRTIAPGGVRHRGTSVSTYTRGVPITVRPPM